MQGMGWLCLEELIWGDKEHPWVRPGHLFTKGPGTYKIPTANDIPVDFRVELLRDVPNPRAIHSSKVRGGGRVVGREGARYLEHGVDGCQGMCLGAWHAVGTSHRRFLWCWLAEAVPVAEAVPGTASSPPTSLPCLLLPLHPNFNPSLCRPWASRPSTWGRVCFSL